jgi:hypothetical protein
MDVLLLWTYWDKEQKIVFLVPVTIKFHQPALRTAINLSSLQL